MTCRDCKKEKNCLDKYKSYSETDGDSWANWCDDFESVHKSTSVTFHGIRAVQTGYNFHIIFTKGDKFIGHMSCTKKRTKKELIKDILLMEGLINGKGKSKNKDT